MDPMGRLPILTRETGDYGVAGIVLDSTRTHYINSQTQLCTANWLDHPLAYGLPGCVCAERNPLFFKSLAPLRVHSSIMDWPYFG